MFGSSVVEKKYFDDIRQRFMQTFSGKKNFN